MDVLLVAVFSLVLFDQSVDCTVSGFYAENGVEQTTYLHHRLLKKERKEMQQEILSLLGLHHKPKPHIHGKDNSAPKYMLNLYESFVDEDSGVLKVDTERLLNKNVSSSSISAINNADMIMSFMNVAHTKHMFRHEHDRRYLFDMSEVMTEESIMGAEFRIFKNVTKEKLYNESFSINIYKIQQGSDLEDRELVLIDNQNVDGEYEGWLTFNVTNTAISWNNFPQSNMGLFIDVRSDKGHNYNPKDIALIGREGPEDKQGFMVAFFKYSQDLHVRRTRSVRKKPRPDNNREDDSWLSNVSVDEGFTKKSCQKKSLFVSFKELGWQDWIIAPDGYAAYYCQGECTFPLNAHMNATNHAIVQTLVHLMTPSFVPKPCCAPTRLAAISVLYFDDNSNVILKKYRNMVVKSCGCH